MDRTEHLVHSRTSQKMLMLSLAFEHPEEKNYEQFYLIHFKEHWRDFGKRYIHIFTEVFSQVSMRAKSLSDGIQDGHNSLLNSVKWCRSTEKSIVCRKYFT